MNGGRRFRPALVFVAAVGLFVVAARGGEPGHAIFPLERTAYFIGEKVLLALPAKAGGAAVKLEAVNADGRVLLYEGAPGPILLDTARLAPGDYVLELDGAQVASRFTLTSTLRKSAASLQDESAPQEKMNPDEVVKILREADLSAVVHMAVSDAGRFGYLDTLARAGTLLLVNPDTRPTSFFPTGNHPEELDGLSQRMVLTAQANGRYPNFGGFCYGWDTTGYGVGGRKGLMTYWGWGDKTQALRSYIDRVDRQKMEEFTRRTGLQPVSEAEYIAYLLAIKRPEQAPAIDLPTKLWLDEIALHTQPMPDAERAAFEKRLDAWSGYLMGLYREAYSAFGKNLRSLDPTLRNTASVQVDHAPTRFGQYFPAAYEPLDLQYQSTWNDQVGGPDYAYQWLLTAALLDMHRNGKPTWISNAFGAVHGRARIPGKFVRVAANGLAYGVSGIGFALEGFSNILGGMNSGSSWNAIRDQAGGADVRAGREFLDRFAALALEGTCEHGVGILFSKSQYGRQNITMGFGPPPYRALVSLARLGYTPRFVTEEDLEAGRVGDLDALLVLGQTVPLPEKAAAGLDALRKRGARVLADGNTTVAIAGAEKLSFTFPRVVPGKPHNWAVPNMAAGDNDALMTARWHKELAPVLLEALGETGRALFSSEKGADTQTTLLQISGGKDVTYLVAVNDSHIQSQADWYQVKEKLIPSKRLDAKAIVYDCTEEKELGAAGPLECDLTMTTARVYAILRRPIKTTYLDHALQDQTITVSFFGEHGQHVSAMVPFHLAVVRPDGKVFQELYRSTDRKGVFQMRFVMPANAPAGTWSLTVRSQLDGRTATRPFKVEAAKAESLASAVTEPVIVRERTTIDGVLQKGTKAVLPIFDSPSAAALSAAAEKIKEVLAAKGVEVEIRRGPALATYWLAYELSDAQKAENARVEKGEAIGKIKRETVNGNDWYSGLSGYRFPLPVILLDLAGVKGCNPMAEALDKAGLLWPRVTDGFPGKGRAVVQGIHWAFGPRVPALVIQAADAEGLLAGAQALAALPEDRLTPGIRDAKMALFRQCHVGSEPTGDNDLSFVSRGPKAGHAPQPFAIQFPGEKPLPADQVKPPEPPVRAARAVPATLTPKELVTYMLDGEKWIEAGTHGSLLPDLRFSQAQLAVLDVKTPGKVKVTYEGAFRYSDRPPKTQAQWEDILALRAKIVPAERRPMEVEVLCGGLPRMLGKLTPTKTGEREVLLEMLPGYVKEKPKSAKEEVVLQLAGELELSAGRQELLLIHRNMVDGMLERVCFGTEPAAK